MTPAGKILIVDDEVKNIKLLSALLTPRGYEVMVASNGDEALQRAEQMQPDLILLDVMRPVMDGFTVCKRDNAETVLIPVIMLTALDQAKDRIKSIEAGVEAIERSVTVLIFSEHANTSEHVMSEVERAVTHHKDIFPLHIAHATPSSELAYFISRYHWLDASTVSLKAVVEQVATMLCSSVSSATSFPTRTPAAIEETEVLFAP